MTRRHHPAHALTAAAGSLALGCAALLAATPAHADTVAEGATHTSQASTEQSRLPDSAVGPNASQAGTDSFVWCWRAVTHSPPAYRPSLMDPSAFIDQVLQQLLTPLEVLGGPRLCPPIYHHPPTTPTPTTGPGGRP